MGKVNWTIGIVNGGGLLTSFFFGNLIVPYFPTMYQYLFLFFTFFFLVMLRLFGVYLKHVYWRRDAFPVFLGQAIFMGVTAGLLTLHFGIKLPQANTVLLIWEFIFVLCAAYLTMVYIRPHSRENVDKEGNQNGRLGGSYPET